MNSIHRFGSASSVSDEAIAGAFADLHAPQDTAERVIAQACTQGYSTQEPSSARTARRNHRHSPARIAVAASLALAFAGAGAYAAVSSGFLQSAFGNKGQDDVQASLVTDTYTAGPNEGDEFSFWQPGVTWVQTSQEDAERLVGAYATPVNASITTSGVTLTVDGVVTDENGLSVATYTLTSNDGSDMSSWLEDNGYGEFSLGEAAPVRGIGIIGANGEDHDWRSILDANLTTSSAVHAVAYFGPFEDASDGAATVSSLASDWHLADRNAPSIYEGDSVHVEASSLVPCTKFADSDNSGNSGATVSISPLGAVVQAPLPKATADFTPELIVDRLVLTYDDGSEYVVCDEKTLNATTSFIRSDGSIALLFNSLADTDKLASVSLTYRVTSADTDEPNETHTLTLGQTR